MKRGMMARQTPLDASVMTSEQKEAIAQRIIDEDATVQEICFNHGLNEKSVYKWVDNLRKGRTTHGKGGRPPVISKENLENFVNQVKRRVKEDNCPTVKETRLILQDAANQTRNDYGKAGDQSKISKSTRNKYYNLAEVHTVKSDPTTEARIKAKADIRNFLSYHVALVSVFNLMGDFFQQLWINSDETTFICGDKDGKKVCYIPDPSHKGPHKAKNSGTMNILIKMVASIKLDGSFLPPIFLIRDPNVDVNGELEIYEVPGLSNDPSKPGYLIFLQDRNGSDAFFKWFLREYIPQNIQRARETDTDLADVPALHSFDGAQNMLNVMLKEETLQKYKESNIQALKSPQASTPSMQACDQKLFKSAKTSLRYMDTDTCKDPAIEKRLRNVMRERNNEGLGHSRVENVVKGLEMITYALQATVTAKLVKSCFADCGFDYAAGAPNFRKLADRCSAIDKISKEQFAIMEARIPDLVAIFTEHGDILEKDYDDFHIPTTVTETGTKEVDSRAVNRQRAIVVTNDNWKQVQANLRIKRVEDAEASKKRAEKKTVKLSEEQVKVLIELCERTKKTQDKVCEEFLALDSIEVKPFKNHVL